MISFKCLLTSANPGPENDPINDVSNELIFLNYRWQ